MYVIQDIKTSNIVNFYKQGERKVVNKSICKKVASLMSRFFPTLIDYSNVIELFI